MKTITKGQYLYLKSKKNAELLKNETVTIEDEEYEDLIQYSNKQITPINNNPIEPEPIEPTPGGDIPIPGEEDPDHDYSQDYLTFETLEDGTFSFTINDLYYSTNNGASWKSLAAGTETELITKGTKVLWKKDSNINRTWDGYNYGNIGTFSSTGKFNISGNILSLAIDTFKTNILGSSSFWQGYFCAVFKDCINLISAKNLILPNKDLSARYGGSRCFRGIYRNLFENCINLIYGPKILPSINTCEYCYAQMFKNCEKLLESPIIFAIELQDSSYFWEMFYGCISLQKITMLAKNIPSSDRLTDWVKGVLPGGIFIKNSKSTFNNIGDSGIPAGWEVIDEEVPEEGE